MAAVVVYRAEHVPRQRVTAAVHSAPSSGRAGLQIRVNGEIRSGHILSLANKKKPLRVCVAGLEGRSSVWNVWANKSASDVYIAIRSSASLHKISLHESGDFRYQLIGMTTETLKRPDLAFTSLVDHDGGRILHQWRRPEPDSSGWVSCMSIIIHSSELQQHGVDNPEKITWLSPPPAGHAVEIQGFLVDPGKGEFHLTGAMTDAGPVTAIGGFKLPNGHVFVMLSAVIPSTPQDLKSIRRAQRHGRLGAPSHFDWSAKNAPRMLMIATASDACPAFVDARA